MGDTREWSGGSDGGDPRGVDVAALVEYRSIRRARAGPRGQYLAYTRETGGDHDNDHALFVRPIEGAGGPTELLQGVSVYRGLRWAPDGGRVVAHRERDGLTRALAVPIEGGAPEELVAVERGQLRDLAPDGRLLFTRFEGDPPARRLYERSPDGTDHRLGGEGEFVFARGLRYGPDGDRVPYACSVADDPAENEDGRIRLHDRTTDRTRTLYVTGDHRTMVKAWAPGGRRLLVWQETGRPGPGVYDLDTDAVQWFDAGDAAEEKPVAFLPGGDSFLSVRKREFATVPTVRSLDGAARELNVDGTAVYDPTTDDGAVVDGGTVLVPETTPTRPERIHPFGLAAGTAGDPIVAADLDVPAGTLTTPETVGYDSADGTTIRGLLFDPDPGASTPAVVWVHGGRHGQVTRRYRPGIQTLAAAGCAVLAPNYRGSAGRGPAFKRAVYGDVGGVDAEDVAAAGRWLRDREGIEADRVGLYGHSYGGYHAYLQSVTRPGLWGAIVAADGLTDLMAAYGDHPDLPGLEAMGDPDEDPAPLRERSPIAHVEAFEGPLLAYHGTADEASPVEQARRFRDAVIETGATAGPDGAIEYVERPGGRHASVTATQRTRRWETVLEFLDRRL